MSDSLFNLASSDETPARDEQPPEFGLVDIIEAFTAMRHECRGQTKASLTLSETLQGAVRNIESLEAKLLAQTATASADESKNFAGVIAEVDNQLTRAVDAAIRAEEYLVKEEESELKVTQDYFARMNGISRWFARPLLTLVTERLQSRKASRMNSATEGFSLLLARLRRLMKDHQIHRVDTLGEAFDAETMNAIGTVTTQQFPSGHVAEQLSPSYLWRGRLLRFAEVRVAI